MSNPGDRWRRAWLVPILVVLAALGLGLARCSTKEKPLDALAFSAASVDKTDAIFSIERPDASAQLIVLRGRVTAKTARRLRDGIAQLKAATSPSDPQWEVDDQLVIDPAGITIENPLGALQSMLLPSAPAALRINSQYGAELTGGAPDDASRTVFGDSLQSALGTGSIKNSLTIPQPSASEGSSDSTSAEAPGETTPAETTPAETTPEETTQTETLPIETVPVDTIPAATTPVVTEPTTAKSTTISPTTTIPATTTIPEQAADTIATVPEAQAAQVLNIIELNGVSFASASAELTGDSNAILDEAARVLTENVGFNVEIGGHSDSLGVAAYNRDLSQRRADAVKAYLVSKGVGAERMSTKGYGPDKPVADNATAAGRAQNRRIEFIVAK